VMRHVPVETLAEEILRVGPSGRIAAFEWLGRTHMLNVPTWTEDEGSKWKGCFYWSWS
jgi:hypothetical protein